VSQPGEKLTNSTLHDLARKLEKDSGTAPGLILLGPLALRT